MEANDGVVLGHWAIACSNKTLLPASSSRFGEVGAWIPIGAQVIRPQGIDGDEEDPLGRHERWLVVATGPQDQNQGRGGAKHSGSAAKPTHDSTTLKLAQPEKESRPKVTQGLSLSPPMRCWLTRAGVSLMSTDW